MKSFCRCEQNNNNKDDNDDMTTTTLGILAIQDEANSKPLII